MEANPISFFHPKELHNNTSFLTMTAYVLNGLMVYLNWPHWVGYLSLLILTVNIILIGILFYQVLNNEEEKKMRRNWLFAILRTVINLVLLFLVLYHIELI
ncbi:hypothetical protein SAMN04488057_12136 [Cyclobacterium lianum]|uniref:Uncharacterized protein n=1 Tax=Cyclobacterium lianum TaxID=388280 RepID=A0A1M7QNX6_9BACT|nr:hypothetical protein [Cyclobacterium lianum]SHN33208.1 hypothetical protein SAMN04488057_12136 [Cyclobacterium lianum]